MKTNYYNNLSMSYDLMLINLTNQCLFSFMSKLSCYNHKKTGC